MQENEKSNKKIKVSAPRENPHICYIPFDRAEKIKKLKESTNLSLYSMLSRVAGCSLNSKEDIHSFKVKLRKEGWHNIGEWATALIDFLSEIPPEDLDLTTVNIKRGE